MRRVGPLLLMSGIIAQSALGQFNPRLDMIFTSKDAVVLGPAIAITKGIPRESHWSSDGKWLFIESLESKFDASSLVSQIIGATEPESSPSSETVLSIYSVDRNSQAVVARFPASRRSLDQVEWLPGNRAVAFTLYEMPPVKDQEGPLTQTAYIATAGNGQSFQILKAAENEMVEFHSSEKARSAIVTVTSREEEGPRTSRAHVIGADGRLSGAIQLKENFQGIFWDAKGNGPYTAYLVPKTANKKAHLIYFLTNFQTGALTEVSDPEWEGYEEKSSEYHFQNGASAAQLKLARATKKSLWLESSFESDYKFALVALDADRYEASPTSNAVYYTSQGIGMIRLMPRISKETATKAIQAAVVREAKQVGIAMMMYAADYDDDMPLNDAEWKDSVDPYLRDRVMMEGFNYTYQGGNIGKLADPSKTEIGYKDGPGGKAVVYADGSVQWVPNNSPVTLFTDRRVYTKGSRPVSLVIH